MIEALEFKRHRPAAILYTAFNILGILLWVFGVALTTAFLVKTDSTPVSQSLRPVYQFNPQAAAIAAAQAQAQANMDQTLGFARTLTASFLFTGYVGAGMVCLFLAQALRYIAATAEAAGKHASAYLDVIAATKQP